MRACGSGSWAWRASRGAPAGGAGVSAAWEQAERGSGEAGRAQVAGLCGKGSGLGRAGLG